MVISFVDATKVISKLFVLWKFIISLLSTLKMTSQLVTKNDDLIFFGMFFIDPAVPRGFFSSMKFTLKSGSSSSKKAFKIRAL